MLKLLEYVVLNRDIPEHGLCRGDLGAIVETYEPDGLEVEFVAASGDTQAVLTLTTKDVREIGASMSLPFAPREPQTKRVSETLAPTSRIRTVHDF